VSGINSLPAFVLAAQLGKPECLSLIVKKCCPDIDYMHGKKRLTALAWAAHKGYAKCVEVLLQNGSSAGIQCADGLTALHLAASGGGNPSVARLLLDAGAPVNALSNKRQTPLCLAAQKGHLVIVNLLIQAGANVQNEDEQKFTPLHLASLYGYSDVVETLLLAGASADAKTVNGITPLHYAVQGRYVNCVKLLLDGEAKVDCDGNPFMLIAADNGDVECAKELLQSGCSLDCHANIKVVVNKDYEITDYLTPMLLAASKGHTGFVKLLLENAVDPNLRSSKGWSALDFSVLNSHVITALALIENGALVDDQSKHCGRTSWTLVQHAAHNGNRELVRALVSRLQEQKKNAKNVSAPPHVPATPVNNEPKDLAPVEREPSPVNTSNGHSSVVAAASFARERLEEAVEQRSVAKLMDAIAQANRLVLQIATGSGLASKSGREDELSQFSLGSEVDKARKLLAAIQLEEQKLREERAAVAADAKRESSRKGLADSITAILNGSDPRALSKALTRAFRGGVLKTDPVAVKAERVVFLVTSVSELAKRMAAAENDRDLEKLVVSFGLSNEYVTELSELGGGVALSKVFGADPGSRLSEVEKLITQISSEILSEKKEREEALRTETEAVQHLNQVLSEIQDDDYQGLLRSLELAIEEASKNLFSQDQSKTKMVENARTKFKKFIRKEKKDIKTAATQGSVADCEMLCEKLIKLDVRALDADLKSLQGDMEKLRLKEDVVGRFSSAKDANDTQELLGLRNELTKLGLFTEADEARTIAETLQREERVRSQLMAAQSDMDGTLKAFKEDSTSWKWPDGKKLVELIRRGERFDSFTELIAGLKSSATELADAGRQALSSAASAAEDPLQVAKAVDNFEKSFLSEKRTPDSSAKVLLDAFNADECTESLAEAEKELRRLQDVEKEKILAEAEKVKLELELAAATKHFDPKQAPQPLRSPTRASPPAENEYLKFGNRRAQYPAGGNGTYAEPIVEQPPPVAPVMREYVDNAMYEDYERDAITGELVCAHYYLWREYNLVVCSKCGNERRSNNPDWIARVKKREQQNQAQQGHMDELSNFQYGYNEPSYRDTHSIPLSMNHQHARNGTASYKQPPPTLSHMATLINMTSGNRAALEDSFPNPRPAQQQTWNTGYSSRSTAYEPSRAPERSTPIYKDQPVREPTGDINLDFENENFGFDIDSIVDDVLRDS